MHAAVCALASLLVAARAGAVERRIDRVGIPFVANDGSGDPRVAFSARGFAGTTFVTRDGEVVYSLKSRKASARSFAGWTIKETALRAAGESLRPSGEEPAPTHVARFIGSDPAQWRTDVETYEAVSLGKVWPGISLELRVSGASVEKIYTLEPGADVSRVRMRMDGARSIQVAGDRSLVARTGIGEIRMSAPIAYQVAGGRRKSVSVRYRTDGRVYGFALGAYDHRLPVVIDPLLQSTYLGGSATEDFVSLAVHPTSHDVYVAGWTFSADFPGTTGGAQPSLGDSSHEDAFVARLDASLSTLLQASYFGGTGSDRGYALAVHPGTGDVYVAGLTASTDLAGTAGGSQPASAGNTDGFVARFNAELTVLRQATYLGGSDSDEVASIAIDPVSGQVYVAGDTSSSNFPRTAGGAQTVRGGGLDVYVARLNANLTALAQSTYLGGMGDLELGYALAISPVSGDVYVAGVTNSPNFPGTAGGAQPAAGGVLDGYVARFNANLTTLAGSTYLGGSGVDIAVGLAIHPTTGEVYAVGRTDSTAFPGTAGGAQPIAGGSGDGYVTRLNASLSTILQSTYLGGSDNDFCRVVVVDASTVYVGGGTSSTGFPHSGGGAQPTNGGATDAFIARLNTALTAGGQATYLGGSGVEFASGLALRPASGELYVAGRTESTNFPHTSGGARSAPAGGGDAFVSRLSTDLAGGGGPAPCVADATTLCLNGGRFGVRASWSTNDGRTGSGQAVSLTGDTGYFWFFSANNVEMIVKVVSGCGFNSRIWTFAAGLTNVNVVLTVTDSQTGASKSYVNPLNTAFQPIQDTDSFAACSTGPQPSAAVSPPPSENVARSTVGEAADVCTPDATTLCLSNGRFRVQTQWTTRDARTGAGQAIPLTGDTGYFWFFSANNVEMIVKVVPGCAFNARYWTFAGGLTDVDVVMTVTDTQSGQVKSYRNPQGTPFQPIQDTAAFATCP